MCDGWALAAVPSIIHESTECNPYTRINRTEPNRCRASFDSTKLWAKHRKRQKPQKEPESMWYIWHLNIHTQPSVLNSEMTDLKHLSVTYQFSLHTLRFRVVTFLITLFPSICINTMCNYRCALRLFLFLSSNLACGVILNYVEEI